MPYPKFTTILLVDDNPDDRLLARRELSQEFEGITIYEAIDQKEFDQMLAAAEFDLVITDYQLGWSNGIKILQTIKAALPKCPVIMFTNTGTQEIAVEAMKSGLSDYVLKSPLHFVRLGQAVRTAWQQFQLELRTAQLEGQLQALLTQLAVGIFRSTPDGHLLDVNPALLNILSAPDIAAAQAKIGTHLAIPSSYLSADPSSSISEVTDAARVKASQTREIEVQQADRPLWLRVITTLSFINGEAIVDGLVEDITARKQAEQSLQQLNQTLEAQVKDRTQKLEAVNQELESFTYSVSHDLRSPIRQIDGFVHLLKDQLKHTALNEKPRHYFTVITQLTQQAGSMIDGLLDFSRTGRVSMRLECVAMDEIVRELQEKIDAQLAERAIRWEIAPLPAVECDRALIKIVWQNLFDNAAKFTAQQPQPTITVQAHTADQEVIFSVQDNGIGFRNQQADRIFDMFQQVHGEEQYGGTGIGLASVKRIISRHQGRVWAEGALHQGATIYFSLPRFPSQTSTS